MKPTTVYLHIGAGKTGTSAIQVALARNREALARCGVIYPASRYDELAEKGMITSGNSDMLHPLLWPRTNDAKKGKMSIAQLAQLLRDNRGKSLLFSSEQLANAPRENFEELYKLIRDRKGEVKIIYYVRHLMDYALSLFNQSIKGGGLSPSLDRFLKTYKCDFAEKIGAFSEVVGRDNFIVHLYDLDRHDLFAGFLELLGPNIDIGHGSVTQAGQELGLINRSLTPEELQIMQTISAGLRENGLKNTKPVAKAISRWILNSRPSDRVPYSVTSEQLVLLEKNNSGVLDYVNEFAVGKFVLKLASDDIAVGPAASPVRRLKVLNDTISVLLDYIASEVSQRRPQSRNLPERSH